MHTSFDSRKAPLQQGAVRGQNQNPSSTGSAPTAPGVHALAPSSSSLGSYTDMDAKAAKDRQKAVNLLNALSSQLDDLVSASNPPLTSYTAVFEHIKLAQDDIEEAYFSDLAPEALWKFQRRLLDLLPELAALLTDGKSALAQQLDLEGIRTLCNGLGILASTQAQDLFGGEMRKEMGTAPQVITDALLERALAVGLPDAIESNGVVLDILNWASRALKARLVAPNAGIGKTFERALALFENWSDCARTDTSSTQKAPFLSAKQLGKCAVQIDSILKYDLIALDASITPGPANRERLANCVLKLYAPGVMRQLKLSVGSVTIISIGNLFKDLMEARMLPLEHAGVLPALAALADAIGKIPHWRLLHGDCRTLSNCANFLRVADEIGVPAHDDFAASLASWDSACHALLACIASPQMTQAQPSAQASSNLTSFVKCRAKRLLKNDVAPALAAQLRLAARQLVAHLIDGGSAAFRSLAQIGGLLSGLAYLLSAKLVSESEDLSALIAKLVDALGSCGKDVDGDTERVLLPALYRLSCMGVIALDAHQPALACLKLPCRASSGRITAEDLKQRFQTLKVVEEEEAALPPEDVQAKPVMSTNAANAANAANAPAPKPPRPGYTSVITDSVRPVQFEEASHHASSQHKKALPGKGEEWKKPGKTARQKVELSSAPSMATRENTAEKKSTPVQDLRTMAQEKAAEHQKAAPAQASTASARTGEKKGVSAASPVSTASTSGSKKTLSAPKAQAGKAAARGTTETKAPGKGKGKATSPDKEWFALLKADGEPALERLQQLGSNPAVLNARERAGKEERGALFHALVHGKPGVVEWLLRQGSGYRMEMEPGPLMDAAGREIGVIEDAQCAAMQRFLELLLKVNPSARIGLKTHLAQHRPLHSRVERMLQEQGLMATNQTQAETTKSRTAVKGTAASKVKNTARRGPAPSDEHLPWFEELLNESDQARAEARLKSGTMHVNQIFLDAKTPLILACERGNIALAKALLAVGADVDQGMSFGTNSTMVESSDDEAAAAAQARINARDRYDLSQSRGATALMAATKLGNIALMQALLDAGAKVNQTCEHGSTAVLVAAQFNQADALKLLRARGARLNNAIEGLGTSALMTAASADNGAVLQALLEAGVDVEQVNSNGATALLVAAMNGHVAAVKALIAAGAKVDHANRNGATALFYAAQSGHIGVVNALIEAGADLDHARKDGATALNVAAERGHAAVLKALVLNKAKLDCFDAQGKSAITVAVASGHMDVLEILLAAGANVHRLRKDGISALMMAADAGRIDMLMALLRAGAKVDQISLSGQNALLFAIDKGHTAIVDALLTAGARVDHVAHDGETVLMTAAARGRIGVLKLVLEKGKASDLIARHGGEAVVVAVQEGHIPALNALIEAGADVNHVVAGHWTALKLAEANSRADIAAILRKAGARASQAS